MRNALLLLLALTLTSCATVFNKKSQVVYLYSTTNKESVKVRDSIYKLPLRLEVLRAKTDLNVTLLTDSIALDYTVKSNIDPKIIYNLGGLIFAPIGFAVDLTNPKRFVYEKKIYLDPKDEKRVIGERSRHRIVYKFPKSGPRIKTNREANTYFKDTMDTKKGDIYFYGTIALMNYLSFDLPKGGGRPSGYGYGYGGLGFSYYYTDKNYVSLGIGANSSIKFLPVFNDFILGAYTVKLENFHQFNRFNIGYGVFRGSNEYMVENEDYHHNVFKLKSKQKVVGLVLSANLEVIKNLHVGLSYKSSLYEVGASKGWINNHAVSLEVMYKLRLRRK